jgi:hypothetical protein
MYISDLLAYASIYGAVPPVRQNVERPTLGFLDRQREKSEANSDRPRGLSMKQGFAAAGVPQGRLPFIAEHSIDNFIFH